jgi:hypothetical protein
MELMKGLRMEKMDDILHDLESKLAAGFKRLNSGRRRVPS